MKSNISVAGKAATHDGAEDVGVTSYRNVSAGRVKGCENVSRGINFNRLPSTRGRGANPIKLDVTNPAGFGSSAGVGGYWRDHPRDAEAARVGGCYTRSTF